MVVIPNRKPDEFVAISRPARHRMLYDLIETAHSVNRSAQISVTGRMDVRPAST